MRSLRVRLILSHLAPFLIVVPLLGLTLYYLLQVQEQLTILSEELMQEADAVARLIQIQPEQWTEPDQAELLIEIFSGEDEEPAIQVTLLQPNGEVMATNLLHEGDEETLQPPALPELDFILEQEDGYLRLEANLAQVLVPIVDPNGQVIGLVSLTRELDGVAARLPRLRTLLVSAIVGELLVGVIIGLGLALHLQHDLQRVTNAISSISLGQSLARLSESRGPTEFRVLFQAYNTMVERLKTVEETRSQLLANMVHEIGRPLGALHAAIQALARGADQDPAFRQELLEGMEAQVDRLWPLLDNLSELHGQLLGVRELDRRPTPLADWLRRVAVPWQAAAQKNSIRWQTDLPPDLPTLAIDRDRMAQAVGNLLSNSVKYTPAGGTITLAAHQAEDNVAIQVRDTGPGISPEEQEAVFTPFFRSRIDTRFPQGMGLGLTIARDIVVAHGGRLELQSERGKGSQFTLYLPLVDLIELSRDRE